MIMINKTVKKIKNGKTTYHIRERVSGDESKFYIIRKSTNKFMLKRPIYLDNKYHDSLESALEVVNKDINK
ncbi:MAG: hypothetical protein SLAVMIC_00333 [uncultured marine phage]|uniref:Uncharacterized protein n=1 Tax=uncultured marine phage TaxID=707152 RepID=A0A8D9C8R5_9VIRU|nr:MAG: hypothetical protein SLAVMIC_00333 [uncultured marine phage]